MRAYLWSKIIELAYSVKTMKKMYIDYMQNLSEERFLNKYIDREYFNIYLKKNLYKNTHEYNNEYNNEYLNFKRLKEELGFKIITIYDDIYPEKLRNSFNPPIAFYYIGDISLLKQYLIAVVGSRNSPDKYLRMANNLGKGLNKLNFSGVSGLANGIDSSFHIGIDKSIGVIGCGIDQIYPAINRGLYQKVKEKGGLLSEYPLRTKPLPWHFPRRNRIIAGLGDLLVLVYANERSGSIITLDYTLDLGRDIFLTREMYDRLDLTGYRISELKNYLKSTEY